MNPDFNNYFFLSDIAGINDHNQYVDIKEYKPKYLKMFANSNNKESHEKREFRTVQDIFKDAGKCFKSYLINNANVNSVRVLRAIKKMFKEVRNTTLYDYFILCQHNRIRGKETEEQSISIIADNYKYKIVEIEKEIKIRLRGLNFKGRVDMLAINPKGLKRLIEIKKRARSFRRLSAYEIYQLNFYMYCLGYKKSRLIEVLGERTKCTTVRLNVQLVLDALLTLENFFWHSVKGMSEQPKKNKFDVVIFQLYDICRFSDGLTDVFDNIKFFNKFDYRKAVL